MAGRRILNAFVALNTLRTTKPISLRRFSMYAVSSEQQKAKIRAALHKLHTSDPIAFSALYHERKFKILDKSLIANIAAAGLSNLSPTEKNLMFNIFPEVISKLRHPINISLAIIPEKTMKR